MKEPYLSQFRDLVRAGAGTLDFHDGQRGTPLTREARGDDTLIAREIERVALHRRSVCRLLEQHVGPVERVLDVGCGTGATTVAVALTDGLSAKYVLGVDPNAGGIAAADVRARGHDLPAERIAFRAIKAGEPLPVDDGTFDLVLCVSVLEYLGTRASRRAFTQELLRAARPGGTICLATPNPARLFDYHTRRLLGDVRRAEGFPWASTPWEIRRMFTGHEVRFLRREQIEHGLAARGVPTGRLGPLLRPLAPIGALLPWQKVLVTKAG
jgi:SAM-dependent methyltransferase